MGASRAGASAEREGFESQLREPLVCGSERVRLGLVRDFGGRLKAEALNALRGGLCRVGCGVLRCGAVRWS